MEYMLGMVRSYKDIDVMGTDGQRGKNSQRETASSLLYNNFNTTAWASHYFERSAEPWQVVGGDMTRLTLKTKGWKEGKPSPGEMVLLQSRWGLHMVQARRCWRWRWREMARFWIYLKNEASMISCVLRSQEGGGDSSKILSSAPGGKMLFRGKKRTKAGRQRLWGILNQRASWKSRQRCQWAAGQIHLEFPRDSLAS